MNFDDMVVPYFPCDVTIEWCLPYELSVICWKTRRVLSRCDLNTEREVNKAIALLEPQPLQYDFKIKSSMGAGWTELRLQFDKDGMTRLERWLDRNSSKARGATERESRAPHKDELTPDHIPAVA